MVAIGKSTRELFTAVAVTAVIAASPATGADFTVAVPVDLSRIPQTVRTVNVKCWGICSVTGGGGGGVGQLHSGEAQSVPTADLEEIAADLLRTSWDVGSGRQSVGSPAQEVHLVGAGRQVRIIPADTGEFHETVMVSFSAVAPYAPDNVKYYACAMRLFEEDGTDPYVPLLEMQGGRGDGALVPVGSEPVMWVAGPLNNPAAVWPPASGFDECTAH